MKKAAAETPQPDHPQPLTAADLKLDPGMIVPVPDKVGVVRMAPGDVVRIFVTLGDGREVGRVVQAGHDGALRITAAPDPPAPIAGG